MIPEYLIVRDGVVIEQIEALSFNEAAERSPGVKDAYRDRELYVRIGHPNELIEKRASDKAVA